MLAHMNAVMHVHTYVDVHRERVFRAVRAGDMNSVVVCVVVCVEGLCVRSKRAVMLKWRTDGKRGGGGRGGVGRR